MSKMTGSTSNTSPTKPHPQHQTFPSIASLVRSHNSHSNTSPFISLEFFPPRTPPGQHLLLQRIYRLSRQLKPLFLDFTCGAAGASSTLPLTQALCVYTQTEFSLPANMHLTCSSTSKENLEAALNSAAKSGINNILTLRGDKVIEAGDMELTCALELLQFVHSVEIDGDGKEFEFSCCVAGYPEGHPDRISELEAKGEEELALSPAEALRVRVVEEETGEVKRFVCKDEDFQKEIQYLKKKIQAGGRMIITQMFFDAKVFIEFVKACRKSGIDESIPIVPGIMCVSSYPGFLRMTALCKTRVPDSVRRLFQAANESKEEMVKAGIEFGVGLCQDVLEIGRREGVEVKGLHFYTLNSEDVVVGILQRLGKVDSYDYEMNVPAELDLQSLIDQIEKRQVAVEVENAAAG